MVSLEAVKLSVTSRLSVKAAPEAICSAPEGLTESSTIESCTVALLPAASKRQTETALGPSPAGSVQGIVAANGCRAAAQSGVGPSTIESSAVSLGAVRFSATERPSA